MGQDPQRLERLWAPWRLEYVARADDANSTHHGRSASRSIPSVADLDCFLCRSQADSADRENLVIYRGKHVFAVLNRYPYNNGHLLIAPLAHQSRLDGLTSEVQLELYQAQTKMVALLEAVIHPDGFNIGLNLGAVAGAGVPGHLHWHTVPRWNGDTNFMPALAATRVIPQSLEALWELLTVELKSNR